MDIIGRHAIVVGASIGGSTVAGRRSKPCSRACLRNSWAAVRCSETCAPIRSGTRTGTARSAAPADWPDCW